MYNKITDEYLKGRKNYKCFVSGDSNFQWYYCQHTNTVLPNQGWKIHIAANYSNAEEILNITVPYLIENNLSFKHPFGENDLLHLNSGRGSVSQVGKFITIYFINEEEFVTHIKKLCSLFKESYSVPFIITDKQYDIRYPIFYRYGAIEDKNEIQNERGIIENLISDASGNFQEDTRGSTFFLPEGIVDPFEKIGVANQDYTNKYLAKRFVTLERISESYKAEIYLGIDLQNNYCTIKMARPKIEIEKNIYSDSLLENESTILSLLNEDCFPKLHGSFIENNRRVIVTNFFEGFNLHEFIYINAAQGIFITKEQTKKIFLSLLENIKKLEIKGIIHNDLKPNNIIINKRLETSIVDFETSYIKSDNNTSKSSIKTRGYYSETETNNPDYYALGMILYFIQTGYNISDAPRENNILERPLQYMTGRIIPDMEKFILNLCGTHYNSIDAIIDDFKTIINSKGKNFTIKQRDIKSIANSYHNISGNIAAWLLNNCIEKNNYTFWKSNYIYNSGEGRMDINVGSAGILIFLSYYLFNSKPLQETNLQKFISAIKYISTNRYDNQITGLFVGESGKVLATIISLCYLHKFAINLIVENIEYIKKNPHPNDDLFNGKAGVGFLFLILYIITNDKNYLDTATEISNEIISNCEIIGNNIVWKDFQTEKYYLGFAHGISGIGYFLLLLYKYTRKQNLLETAKKISDTLLNNRMKYSKSSKIINWPTELGGDNANNHWCHGTPGTAYFFLELYKLTKDEQYLSVLSKCAHTIICASTCMNPTMCHGLAGNINFLINFYQLTKSKKIKAEIFRLSEVLKMSGILSDNYYLFPSESSNVITPDFWVGFSGTAYVLERLTDIENHLDFLSTEFYHALV